MYKKNNREERKDITQSSRRRGLQQINFAIFALTSLLSACKV